MRVIVIGLVLLMNACTAAGAQVNTPQPRGFVVPATCELLSADSRAFGTSWDVECQREPASTLGMALRASGWVTCDAKGDELRYRQGEFVTTIVVADKGHAKLAQFARGDEC